MKRHFPLIPAALVAAFALAACGSDTPQDSTSTVGDTIPAADSGLLAPRPIEVTSGGGGGAAAPAAAETDRASGDMAIMPYYIADYVVGDGMPALPTNDIGYVYQAGATVTAEQVAALAAAFGVTGEPVRIDDGYGVQWRVGPEDGTGPALWVYQDAQLSWNYNSAWAMEARAGCAVASSGEIAPDVASDVPAGTTGGGQAGTDIAVAPPDTIVCDEPQPPVGVPTGDAAEQLARDLLTAAGQDPADYRFETYADQWFASVTAIQRLDGAIDGRRWDFGFGAEGVLQYASGQLADPIRVGPYPLIGLDEAVARLNDQTGMWGGYAGGIADGIGVAEPAIAGDVAVDVPEGSVSSEGAAVDAMPIGSIPEPEPITITLVDVQADVWWAWDVDGSVWLLPAYRFIGDDGGWYTVPAVTDEFLIQVEPPVTEPLPMPMPEPMPPETAPGAPTPAPDAPPVTTADFVTTDFDDLVGLPLDRFTELAKERGAETRVVIQDGVGLDQTADFSPSRVNVEVTTIDGVQTVTSVTSIG
jgi:hypothetical protein